MDRAREHRRAWVPPVALATIVVLDLVGALRSWPVVLEGPRDETAHLLTAWLFLASAVPADRRRFCGWVLAGAVLLDLDHIPLLLWEVGAAAPNGRPVTHGLVTVLVLLAGAALVRRWRVPLLALALGVGLHLVRDLGTGPGVPLLWPLTPASVQVPYVAYLAVVAALTVGAVRAAAPGLPRPSAAAHQVGEP
ncbi:MAG TPA: metal-dependent hydrolase [Blastococcus sp.]|jgi:inner membrane protein|nr:metal-dependent hydrolase [Blastococcus sp.]